MRRALSLLAMALAAALRGAEAPPAVAGMDPLVDNGRSFTTAERRMPLRCLDAPALLSQDPAQVAKVLDRAAAAGFNAVSFEAPLFGPQGLSPNLGIMDPRACKALTGALEACGLRRLYAFPVLYPPRGVDGLVGAATDRAVFFSGRHAWGWQCWTLARAAALTVDGAPLTRAPEVGGWILYRGAWPGGPPLASGEAQALSPSAVALEQNRLRLWTASTVQFARKIGFQQELGLGLWARADLPSAPATRDQDLDGSAAGAPPVESPSETLFSAQDLDRQSRDSDVLPPVAGSDGAMADDAAPSIDDSAVLPAAPQNPWELEGLDWKAVENVFQGLPMAGQLNFMEFTQDTEDWYGVGARLAQAADRAEVPVLWRQDWRSASRYERGRHLAAPPPLAGLAGPWPDDDWPEGAIWAPQAEGPGTAPFRVQSLGLRREGDAVLLEAGLSRPAALTVSWGRGLPLDHATLVPDGPGILRRATLKGLTPGGWFLLRLKAVSPRFGVCLLRTRWVRAPL